ncbi:hypothetical protein [Xanthomonas fragariae]|uniref:hypothetical protein n=1 Tax=Xanthomonas fragariae TaxID=48664 RepID=UPI0022AA2615|nr:hypothetical protein [Xanthomonas fragariae]WAT14253.1 hypothetical protein OZ429_14555 [Xanthomonas fragariae]
MTQLRHQARKVSPQGPDARARSIAQLYAAVMRQRRQPSTRQPDNAIHCIAGSTQSTSTILALNFTLSALIFKVFLVK